MKQPCLGTELVKPTPVCANPQQSTVTIEDRHNPILKEGIWCGGIIPVILPLPALAIELVKTPTLSPNPQHT
jgi:hypothetical protein